MTEFSAVVTIERDGLNRPTCLRSLTSGDTLSDSILSDNVNDAVSSVNASADNWNSTYYTVGSYSSTWGGGGVLYLTSVGDVTGPPLNNQTLVYNTGTNKWTPTSYTLTSLADVSVTSTPTNGYVLAWNTAGGYWEAVAQTGGGGGATDLDGLTDVTIATPADNQALIYENATSQWKNKQINHTWLTSTGTNSHSQIDTHISNHATSASTYWNPTYVTVNTKQSNWDTAYSHATSLNVNPHGTDLSQLDDVTIATPLNYQGLLYFTSINEWQNSQINHTWLSLTGTKTHATIDTELATAWNHATSINVNPHDTDISQLGDVSLTGTPLNNQALLYFTSIGKWQNAQVSHNNISVTGTNTHANIDTHITNHALSAASYWNPTYVTVNNNQSNWDTAYTHSQIIDANPHATDISSLAGVSLDIPGLQPGHFLKYKPGLGWTNDSIAITNVATGGFGTITNTSALTFSANQGLSLTAVGATLTFAISGNVSGATSSTNAFSSTNALSATSALNAQQAPNGFNVTGTVLATTVSATTYLNIRPNVSSVNSAATTSFTAGGDYDTYLINTTTTSVIAYLPEASSYTNKMITFSKVDDGGSYRSVTVSGAQLVTATNTVILYDPTESVTVISNGTNWYSLDYDRSYGVVFVCKNSTGATLTKGTPVRVSGATGANVLITPASAVNNAIPESPSGFLARVIGVVEHDIPDGEFGHVLTKGSLYKYNTDAFNEGDALYLAASGGLTNIKPTPPYEEIFIGIVTRKQTSNGSILVDIQNPEHINSIVGFNLASSISERDVIAYDLTTSTFKNYNPSSFNVSSATSATNAFSSTNAFSATNAFSSTNTFSATNALSSTSALNASRAPAGFTVTGTLLATNISATNFSGIDHDTDILNVGTYTHAAIDAHITDTANPHSVTAEQVGNSTAQWNASALQDIGVKSSFPNDRDILIYSSPFNQWAAGSLLATDVGNTTAQWNASAIRSSPLSATLVPTTGQSLVYNGSVWTASTVVATGGGGGGGIADASSLRGSPLSATLVPTAGQALMYNGSVWTASAALFAYTYGSGAPTGGSDGDIYLQTDVEALQVATVSATTYLNLPSSVITWTNATSATNAFSSTYAFSATNALSSTNAFSSTYALSATSALNAQQAPNGFTVTGTATATTASSTNLLTLSGDVSSTRLTDYSERIVTFTITTSAITLDLNTAQVFSGTLNSNISSVTISNPDPRSNTAQGFTMLLMADGTARTITWPAAVKWPAGTGPTLTSTNGKVDILSFFSPNNGTTWYGFIGGQNY